jgi:ADP-heptose:LPS heptosyltransferase
MTDKLPEANNWHTCKNILCIRPDNMGDVIMMTPALRALKQTLGCHITLLTSCMGSLITPYISYIDETLIYDLPWVKSNNSIHGKACIELIEKLKTLHFDGAIIFTVYSQNPLPAAMLAYMANIPLCLGYCRENPYELLTDWLPDKEPYSFVQHQVERDLRLVAHIGAVTNDECLSLNFDKIAFDLVKIKLRAAGVDINRPYIIMHPGVSEVKREYPVALWIETAKRFYKNTGKQILVTGAANQKSLTDNIKEAAGEGIFSVAGLFNIEEFIAVIANAQLLVSVNTATIHIAAALNIPSVVLYALTNPQHTPWKVPSVVLQYSIPNDLQSKNAVIRYVNKKYFNQTIPYPSPEQILQHALQLLEQQEQVAAQPDVTWIESN